MEEILIGEGWYPDSPKADEDKITKAIIREDGKKIVMDYDYHNQKAYVELSSKDGVVFTGEYEALGKIAKCGFTLYKNLAGEYFLFGGYASNEEGTGSWCIKLRPKERRRSMKTLFVMTVFIVAIFCSEVKGAEIFHAQELERNKGKIVDGRGKVTELTDETEENPEVSHYIPKKFGRLVQVDGTGWERYLWFEADDGTIRRVGIYFQTDDWTSVSNKVDIFKRK